MCYVLHCAAVSYIAVWTNCIVMHRYMTVAPMRCRVITCCLNNKSEHIGIEMCNVFHCAAVITGYSWNSCFDFAQYKILSTLIHCFRPVFKRCSFYCCDCQWQADLIQPLKHLFCNAKHFVFFVHTCKISHGCCKI